MSATHKASGQLALKNRSTRSGAGALSRSWTVVRAERRRWTPSRPSARMRRATRLREQRVPVSRSSASLRARAEGGRFDQAQ